MNCGGGSEVSRDLQRCICQYCGAVLEIGNSNLRGSSEGRGNGSDGEALVAAVKQVEAQYFCGVKRFEDVVSAYNEVELAAGNYADFWLDRARFYAKGNLKEFTEGRVSAGRRLAVIDQYVFWMDKGISLYSGNTTPLKMEKEKTIGEINNAFEGRKRRAEERIANLEAKRLEEARAKAEEQSMVNHDALRLEEAKEKAKMAAALDEMEDAAAKKKKRGIIVAVVVGIVALLLILLLRACGSNNDEYPDVSDYEEFLALSYVLDLINDDWTRSDVFELGIDFGDQDPEDSGAVRVVAPGVADLDTITFHFDQDDVLIRVVIGGASYFNNFDASNGLDYGIASGFDAEEIEIDEDVLSFLVDELLVGVTLRTNSFNIDVSPNIGDELTAEQRAIWDLIEERIEEGYDSWSELISWAEENDIPFSLHDGGAPPIEAIQSLMDQYGLDGDYVNATPGLGSEDDPDEVLLLLHFENLTYNETIAELYNLNRNSGRELHSWLDNDGRTRLETQFETVEIIDMDDTGQLITEAPEVFEFVRWDVEFFDIFTPPGEGRVTIERVYRILDVARDDEDEDDDDDEDDNNDWVTTLHPGIWTVGSDLQQGRYQITGDSGGSIVIWRGPTVLISESLGTGGLGSITTYLMDGDIIDITDVNNVNFEFVVDRSFSSSLGAGNWVVGTDIAPGRYYATTPVGTGQLIIWRGNDVVVNEILGDNAFGVERVRVDVFEGDVITITGVDRVDFQQ